MVLIRKEQLVVGLIFILSVLALMNSYKFIPVSQTEQGKGENLRVKVFRENSLSEIENTKIELETEGLVTENIESESPLLEVNKKIANPSNENGKMPTIIILVASLPRSGSTMFSELLRTQTNSVLFFEPDHKTEHDACARISSCISSYIKTILTCEFDSKFEKWQKRKFFNYFHSSVSDCQSATCKKAIDIYQLCKTADFTLTKLIRVPVGFLEPLLRDSSVNVKLIHLVRDPRGSIASNKKMGWVADPLNRCTKVHDDLLAYQYLSQKYPNNVFSVKYEEFCLKPLEVTKSMFKFAFGVDSLQSNTLDYINTHTVTAEMGAMNTARVSSEYYQEWRWKIKEQLFLAIEKEKTCQMVLDILDYTIFQKTENLKNINISLFKHSSNYV